MNRFIDVIYPLAGFALIVTGAAWIYKPLGLIVAGIFLMSVAVLGKTIRK
jgi:hypothetical protein